jgi:hypothetical protein
MRKILFALAIAFAAASCGSTPPQAPQDFAMAGDAGPKQYGDECFTPGTPGDCDVGLICDMFAMNTIHRCTRLCDANPPTNCPPPSNGMCNAKNECKFLQ